MLALRVTTTQTDRVPREGPSKGAKAHVRANLIYYHDKERWPTFFGGGGYSYSTGA